MEKKLVVLGSINIDHLLKVTSFPKPGETLSGKHYQIAFGGKGANQALAAVRSGASTQFIAAIGNNDLGQEVIKQFQKEHIDISGIKIIANQQTGTALIFINNDGQNQIGIYAGANGEVTPAYVRRYQKNIAAADVLLMQLETPIKSVETAAKLAKKAKTTVILNPAPAKPLSAALLKHIDIIIPNQTEAHALTGISVNNTQDARNAAHFLHQKGIAIVVITLGHLGAFISENNRGMYIAGHRVAVTDTIAAGDTFCGTFAAALLMNKPLHEAVNYANCAAAIAVTRAGAQVAIPTKQEIMNFITDQYG